MIRAGDSIVNPVTGERLVFQITSHEDGDFSVAEGRLSVKRGLLRTALGYRPTYAAA